MHSSQSESYFTLQTTLCRFSRHCFPLQDIKRPYSIYQFILQSINQSIKYVFIYSFIYSVIHFHSELYSMFKSVILCRCNTKYAVLLYMGSFILYLFSKATLICLQMTLKSYKRVILQIMKYNTAPLNFKFIKNPVKHVFPQKYWEAQLFSTLIKI